MKKIILTAVLSAASMATWAQATPDILEEAKPTHAAKKVVKSPPATAPLVLPNYSSLLVDLGFCFLRQGPKGLNFWGSRLANVALSNNIRVGNSHFTISPGIGVSFAGYNFKDEKTLIRYTQKKRADFKNAKVLFPRSEKIMNTSLAVHHVELMLETRFNAINVSLV